MSRELFGNMSESAQPSLGLGKSESESVLSQSQHWDSEENPSPDLIGSSQFSTDSSNPSPVSLSITDLLKVREADNGQDDLKYLLNHLISKVTNLDGLDKENVNRLAQLLGSHLSTEVKSEADYHRCVRARDILGQLKIIKFFVINNTILKLMYLENAQTLP